MIVANPTNMLQVRKLSPNNHDNSNMVKIGTVIVPNRSEALWNSTTLSKCSDNKFVGGSKTRVSHADIYGKIVDHSDQWYNKLLQTAWEWQMFNLRRVLEIRLTYF